MPKDGVKLFRQPKGKMPAFFETLTDDQKRGKEYLPDLPEVFWEGEHSLVHTLAVKADDFKQFALKSPEYFPRQMLKTWKDLVGLGFRAKE